MRVDHEASYSEFKSSSNFKHVIDTVLLKYTVDGATKTGIVKIHLGFDLNIDELEYKGIEYSDYELRRFLESDPTVLTKIHSVRSQSSHKDHKELINPNFT
jgi:hypothetical protein